MQTQRSRRNSTFLTNYMHIICNYYYYKQKHWLAFTNCIWSLTHFARVFHQLLIGVDVYLVKFSLRHSQNSRTLFAADWYRIADLLRVCAGWVCVCVCVCHPFIEQEGNCKTGQLDWKAATLNRAETQFLKGAVFSARKLWDLVDDIQKVLSLSVREVYGLRIMATIMASLIHPSCLRHRTDKQRMMNEQT